MASSPSFNLVWEQGFNVTTEILAGTQLFESNRQHAKPGMLPCRTLEKPVLSVFMCNYANQQ
jgi:hypothetical protein